MSDWKISFPDGEDLRPEPQTKEEKELLLRLTAFGNEMKKDYGVAEIEWWTDRAPGAPSRLEVALFFKATMPNGVFFEAAISPIMFAQLVTDAPLDDFFEHMHRELTLRVDEWKRGMHEPRTPDLMEHLIGFREWNVDWNSMTIGAIGIGTVPWAHVRDVPWDEAECKAQGRYANAPYGHKAPHPNCHCGFYAWDYFPDECPADYGAKAKPSRVWGVVQAKGNIEVHSDGIRAQFMRPVMLAIPESRQFFVPTDPNDMRAGGRFSTENEPGAVPVEPEGAKDVRRLAKHLGLDAVTWGYVRTKALEYGAMVPEELKPGQV
jgi:hypothetical protein